MTLTKREGLNTFMRPRGCFPHSPNLHTFPCISVLPSLLLPPQRCKTSSDIHASLHISQQFMSSASSSVNKQPGSNKVCCFSSGKAMPATSTAGPLSLHPVFQPSFREDHLHLFGANQALSRAQALSFHVPTTPVKVAVKEHTGTQHAPGNAGV